MKKKSLSVILFIIGFIGAYMIMCYCIPGMRIKLAAEPAEYFIKSIKTMALFKSLISLVVGTILGVLPILICRKKQ